MSLSPAQLEVQDNGGGSITLAWPVFGGAPTSYNVYVNGVLSQNVTVRTATITGLQTTSYSASAIAPTPANGPRPQSMPPVGLVTDALTYTLNVTAVVAGVESASTNFVKVTPQPSSVQLVTPMKRNLPFPLTGNTELSWQ